MGIEGTRGAGKGFLSEEDSRELEQRFNGGPGRAGKVTVLESDGVEYVDAATSARDSQHVETRAATKKEVLCAFGVPETRAGDSSGRTFDNADAEIEMYWRDTMRAHNDIIDSAFDSITAGGIDDDIFTIHDTSGVYVLNRDDKDREGRFKALFDGGLITVDEFREEVGRKHVKRPGTKVLWIPNQGKLAVGDEADEKTMAEAMGAAPAADPNAAPPGADTGLDGDADNVIGGHGSNGSSSNGNGNGSSSSSSSTSSSSTSSSAVGSPFDWDAYDLAEGGTGADFAVSRAVLRSKADPGTTVAVSSLADNPLPPPAPTGIMISIDLPQPTADRLLDTLLANWTGPTEPADNLHLTLVYLGKTTAPDAPTIDDVLAAVEHFAAATPSLSCAISGVGHFAIPEGTATYASVDSPDLPRLRERLVATLALMDIASPSTHGFSPHVTLAYTDPGTPPPDVPIEALSDQLETMTFPVTEVAVHWGGVIYRFPLLGERKSLMNLGLQYAADQQD